ncbi:GNAT family N-acetyltransferase [Agromyces agglutinans]|uniref:GNAT family N-acetyltransferase n=1 Tax=Agromyces agglutinans TaxID=2662258 RepID=UPI001FE283AC|nr:GNAT family N-acetyltransferase [Agromyces agglutinans]
MLHEPLLIDEPIHTSRLALRPHREDDLDDLLAFHGDPEVVRFLPWPVRDREATRVALTAKLEQAVLPEPGRWLVLAVELRETQTVIGEVLLKWSSAEDRQGELGFAFGRAHHGRGYAAEAGAEMLRLGFDRLGLHRITAVCLEDNLASARLLGRLGFAQEARLVDNIRFKGDWSTQLLYALTEDAWRSPTAQAPTDRREIEALVDAFFAAFTSGPDVAARLDGLRDLMLPEAVIVRTGDLTPAVSGVEAFIAPRQAILTDGTLVDFHERAQPGRLEVSGDFAQWFGRYAKAGVLHGEPFVGGGAKSMQFVRTGAGWRISAAVWQDDAA